MRLNAIQLVNFRQHADTRIEFDLGLTGIIGPNGSGKTTILEAVAWALYGQQAARGNRDSIRFLRAGPRAPVRVELDFDLAGHRYRIVRALASAELYLDGGAEPIATTITGVTELVQRRLGMTQKEFFHTYFTGQKELGVMAAMAPAERAKFLSRVLGYDRLRTAQSLVREKRKLIAAEIAGVRSAMPDADGVARMLEDAGRRLAEAVQVLAGAEARRKHAELGAATVAPRWASAQQARDVAQQILADLRVGENDESSRARDSERLDRELEAIASARSELEALARQIAPLSEVLEEFRRLEELSREEGRRQTLLDEERALLEELAGLRSRQVSLTSITAHEKDVVERLAQKGRELEEASRVLEERRTDWLRDTQEAETKRDALRKQYQEMKAQRDHILDLGEHGVCPTCTRVLGENFRTVLDQLEEHLETIAVDGRYFKTRLEQLEEIEAELKAQDVRRKTIAADVTNLEREQARMQSAMQELAQVAREVAAKETRHDALRRGLEAIPTGYDAARHALLREETARLAPLNEQAARLSERVEREQDLRVERERAAGELARVRQRLHELRTRHADALFSDADYDRVRQEYEEAAAAARAAELAHSTARADERTAREGVVHAERAHGEMERAHESQQRLERDRRLHDELDRAYTDLRTDLNFQLRPELSELAGGFLSELTDARYAELELDDQYNVVVLEDGVPKPVISGGEEDLSNLVLRLAISQMIAERAGQSFSLLVLDEVFGSLDETRRTNVVDLLRRLQDRFEQVILITHIESVRDGLDHVVHLEYDEQSGASRVRQTGVAPTEPEELATVAASISDGGQGE